jgi:hypothetical protein
MASWGLPPESTILDLFFVMMAEKGKQRRVLQAQRLLPDTSEPAPLVRESITFPSDTPLTPGQRRIRERVFGDALVDQQQEEARRLGIPALAEYIRVNVWDDTSSFRRSYAEETRKKDIKIENGEIRDRSFTGARLVHRVDNTTDTIVMGIEYVGDKTDMPPGVQHLVSADDLRRGAKAYVLERVTEEETPQGARVTKKRRYVVPCADSKALKKYVEFIYNETVDTYPDQLLANSRRDRQQGQLAA